MRTVTKLLFLLIAFMLGYNPAYSQTQEVKLPEDDIVPVLVRRELLGCFS